MQGWFEERTHTIKTTWLCFPLFSLLYQPFREFGHHSGFRNEQARCVGSNSWKATVVDTFRRCKKSNVPKVITCSIHTLISNARPNDQERSSQTSVNHYYFQEGQFLVPPVRRVMLSYCERVLAVLFWMCWFCYLLQSWSLSYSEHGSWPLAEPRFWYTILDQTKQSKGLPLLIPPARHKILHNIQNSVRCLDRLRVTNIVLTEKKRRKSLINTETKTQSVIKPNRGQNLPALGKWTVWKTPRKSSLFSCSALAFATACSACATCSFIFCISSVVFSRSPESCDCALAIVAAAAAIVAAAAFSSLSWRGTGIGVAGRNGPEKSRK